MVGLSVGFAVGPAVGLPVVGGGSVVVVDCVGLAVGLAIGPGVGLALGLAVVEYARWPKEYTRVWPASEPPASFMYAPTASDVPSALSDTE